jgi:hypothetical protein
MMYGDYLGLNSDYTYQEYTLPVFTPSVTTVEGATIITTINGGGGGQATGPNVTFSGGTTGLNFTATGNTISLGGTLNIANGGSGASTAAGARANFGAAASGVNADITMFMNLAGSGGWNAWTGNSDKTSHATFSGTASVGYVQAELQAVMDKLQEQTEAFKALLDTLLASGVIKL